MFSFWLLYYCLNAIISQETNPDDMLSEIECANHWLNISNCNVNSNNYYSPTITIQTLSGYNTKSLRLYSKISLSIRANEDVIITPHCISMDIEVNPTIINYLSHEWLLNRVEWPSYHTQGDIITFSSTKTHSQYITFSEQCILTPNTTNAVILLFNTNFGSYDIEVHKTQGCAKKNGISIYDTLYNTDENDCFPMQTDERLNLFVINDRNKNDESNTDITESVSVTDKSNDNSIKELVVALIIGIVIFNVICCMALWYLNQKQFHRNLKEISANIVQDIQSNNYVSNNPRHKNYNLQNRDDNTTTVISSLSEQKPIGSLNNKIQIIKGKNDNDLPVLPHSNMTNNTNNTNNTIIWVNKSYFDSNHPDDNFSHNLFNQNQSIHDTDVTDDANVDKLRILLPMQNMQNMQNKSNNNGLHGSPPNTDNPTTLTAITLSDDDWKMSETMSTYANNQNNVYIMNEINEDEADETPIVRPSLHQIGFRSNESNNTTTSSIRLPAYHPNKIKVMDDNKHIPYNKQFVIAVTPPYKQESKPRLTKSASNYSNKSNSLALPNPTATCAKSAQLYTINR